MSEWVRVGGVGSGRMGRVVRLDSLLPSCSLPSAQKAAPVRMVEREKQKRMVMNASSSRPSAASWLEMDVDMARRNCDRGGGGGC